MESTFPKIKQAIINIIKINYKVNLSSADGYVKLTDLTV